MTQPELNSMNNQPFSLQGNTASITDGIGNFLQRFQLKTLPKTLDIHLQVVRGPLLCEPAEDNSSSPNQCMQISSIWIFF